MAQNKTIGLPWHLASVILRLGRDFSGLKGGDGYFAESSISFHSAALSFTSAAAMFSSRCSMEEVPGIGSITGERWRSQARESWETVALWRLAAASSLPPGWASLPAATGNQGMKAILCFSQ